MKKLFAYNCMNFKRYLLSMKIQKYDDMIDKKLVIKKHAEEIYILECLQNQKEIDFSKISYQAINNVLASIAYLEEDAYFSREEIRSQTFNEIHWIAEKHLDINPSTFFTSQLYLMQIFMRMRKVGIKEMEYYPSYLERANFEEHDCESSFNQWGDDLIKDMELSRRDVDISKEEDIQKYSALFHVSTDELNEISKNIWGPIGEILSKIKISDEDFLSSIENQFDIQMEYQKKESKLYIFYNDDTYFPAIKRIEMLLSIFEGLQGQNAVNSSEIERV